MKMKNLILLFILNYPILMAVGEDNAHYITALKGPYFLCDERVIEDRWLVERSVTPLKKHEGNPVIVKDYEWEGTGPMMGGSVLFDKEDSKYKMWYCVWDGYKYYNKLPFSYNMCYAESKNGIEWVKPKLGVFPHEADPRNNYIKLGRDKTQNIDVCLNPVNDQYPGKFLAIHNQAGGVFVSSSEDGKSFTFLDTDAAIPYHSDTQNNFVYDELRHRWFLFCRPRAYAGDHKRRVSMQKSSDLKNWTHERTILIPTETEKQEYYGMSVFRRGDLFWGMVQVYDRITGFMHGELAWSGDGEHWTQLPTHPPFLERGENDSWDHGMVMSANDPVVVQDEMRFYFGGFAKNHHNKQNKSAIGLPTTGRDRLVGIQSKSDQAGTILTRPFLVDQQSLFINAVVTGDIRAELRTDGNKPVKGWTLEDCQPVQKTGYRQEITWKGGKLSDVPVKEVRILFQLDNAKLYTFDFE